VNEEHPVGSAHAGFMPPLVNATSPWVIPADGTDRQNPTVY